MERESERARAKESDGRAKRSKGAKKERESERAGERARAGACPLPAWLVPAQVRLVAKYWTQASLGLPPLDMRGDHATNAVEGFTAAVCAACGT
eukprot:3852495-Pleurochrysis_carterae.AAC.1